MARQDLTVTSATTGSPTTGVALTFTAADTSNFEQFTLNPKDVILVWNTHASTGYTYTVTSVADPYGRTGDITTIALAAGIIHAIGPLSLDAWRQSSGKLYLQASNAAVKWAIYRLP